ncbi:imidazole glycerol phosphate synthase subunit HisH [Gracilimonas sp. BCB1]|uniref:imidazole glycerol phosphate synthase subunit HisH n=1 Tax=Gracilimonas sp. BCB1 TaxID=3152362 RepID=UPI0032D924B4
MIGIIKYKAGNTASVANAVDRLGAKFFFAETPEELEKADAVIFPGVGHAATAMKSLKEKGVDEWLKLTDKPVLGICVGMQLLFESSTEGDTIGLGVIPGSLKKFDESKAKVPHMGWNKLHDSKKHPILKNLIDKHYLYFVHSYYAPVGEHTLATCNYISDFSAIVAKDNFIGVQFHPEKSGNIGSMILQNFLDMVYSTE